MDLMQKSKALEKVHEIATVAGIRLQPVDDKLMAHFNMGDDRSQSVQIKVLTQLGDGSHVINFCSPCMEIDNGFLKGLSKDKAVDLLKRNGKLLFGRFSVVSAGKKELLVAESDQILETMDAKEFEHHLRSIAQISDDYEKEQGVDRF